MSDAFKVALMRSLIGGVVMAGAAFFGQLAAESSLHVAEVAAGSAFFAYLILRGGVEGLIDTQANKAP